tara:strand:+ start:226 stop:504 length:279 start_codon:yes stop_codon:yes gene_type:complete
MNTNEILLNDIKEFVIFEGFEAMKTFSQEDYMQEDDYTTLCKLIAEVQFRTKGLEDWNDLIEFVNEEMLAVIGKETFDCLMQDYFEAKTNGF